MKTNQVGANLTMRRLRKLVRNAQVEDVVLTVRDYARSNRKQFNQLYNGRMSEKVERLLS